MGLLGAVRTSCIIIFIIAGASFLSLAMGFTGIQCILAEQIASLGLSPVMLISLLALFFMLLGCFLDGISTVVLTSSIVLPMIERSGIDLLWFGIYEALVVEMSQITPPVGFNLFVLQGLTKINIISLCEICDAFLFAIADCGCVAHGLYWNSNLAAHENDTNLTMI